MVAKKTSKKPVAKKVAKSVKATKAVKPVKKVEVQNSCPCGADCKCCCKKKALKQTIVLLMIMIATAMATLVIAKNFCPCAAKKAPCPHMHRAK